MFCSGAWSSSGFRQLGMACTVWHCGGRKAVVFNIGRKKSGGGGAGCFVAIQEAIEPQVQHVIVVREQLNTGMSTIEEDRTLCRDRR